MSAVNRLLVALLLVTPAVAEPPSTLTVRGAGTANDMAAAEKAALADAILQAANAVLDDATFSKHKATIIEKVLPKAGDAVKNHEVLKTEKLTDGKVQVRVRATVDRATVLAKLADAKVPVPGVADKDDPSSELREKVVKFCKDKLGQQVGDGECGTLAQEAIKEAGGKAVNMFAENPGAGDYVWGELVFVLEMKDGKRKRDPVSAAAKPGDVIQYRDVALRSSRGIYLLAHHTAIVAEVKSTGEMLIFEQNMQGKKEVTKGTLRPTEFASGWVRVYRPVAK
ncbi:MAG TPA: CHAP domain-containing protein [Gemmataceae bacterium]|jgi:hypothetical protein|nr:CHAP domain-containing protein [Gemmataceae bacterium]